MDSASGGVDGQQALLARLKLDLAQNTSAIKAAKQAARKLQREAATGRLRPAAWRAVLSVYIWSNFNFHIATALAQRLARKKQGGQVGFVLPAEVWQQRLHESVTETAIKEVISAEKGMWKKAEIAAKQFMAESDTVKWLAKQNACHGVAPQAAGVYAHYTSLLVAGGLETKVLVGRSLRAWVRRFQLRWKIGRRRLKPAPLDNPDETARKARPTCTQTVPFSVPPMETDGKGSLLLRPQF